MITDEDIVGLAELKSNQDPSQYLSLCSTDTLVEQYLSLLQQLTLLKRDKKLVDAELKNRMTESHTSVTISDHKLCETYNTNPFCLSVKIEKRALPINYKHLVLRLSEYLRSTNTTNSEVQVETVAVAASKWVWENRNRKDVQILHHKKT
jgi:hypothetical protein